MHHREIALSRERDAKGSPMLSSLQAAQGPAWVPGSQGRLWGAREELGPAQESPQQCSEKQWEGIGEDSQGWEEPEVLEKDLSLIGAEKMSEIVFTKKSRTKHKHLVLQPRQNRARLQPKWRQELCQWWGARGGHSEVQVVLLVLQRYVKD